MSTVRIWQTISVNSADTMRLGRLLGQKLAGGEVLELRSDLGGGKTTFVKGLASGLKVSEDVSSPTFTIQQIYKAKDLSIYHYDFYRLQDDPGLVAEQLAENLNEANAVIIVEWAKPVKHLLPKQRFIIELQPTAVSPDERKVTITYPENNASIIEKIETKWRQK